MAQVLDDGDVAAQAPVHAAALVTHQHAPADGGPAGVCGVGAGSAKPRLGPVSPVPLLWAHARLTQSLTQLPKAQGAGDHRYTQVTYR